MDVSTVIEQSPELNRSKSDSSELQRLSKLLEESKQEAYELRSRLQIAECCALDLEGELEAQQNEAYEKERSHEAALRDIQEEKLQALKDADDRNADLEAEYQILSNKYTDLEKELQGKTDKDQLLKLQRNEQDILQQELREALDALTATTKACEQHKELNSVLQTEKQVLTERVTLLERDLELHKEYLNIAKAQLQDSTEQSKDLQEQLALTQSELSALKSTPTDMQARGNSLFAEVEDDRQKILKQYRTVLARYNHVKGDYSSKCSEVTRLKKEVAKLQGKMEIVEKESKKHYKAYIQNYEIRIQELQKMINDLRNDVKPVYLNCDREVLKFAEKTVENSRKEVISLRDEMEWRSALRLDEAAELLKTRGELNDARSELRLAALKMKKLQEILDKHGIADTTPVDTDEVPVKEVKPPQATVSNLINAIMVPWKQPDQKSSEENPPSITVIQEVHQTNKRTGPINSDGGSGLSAASPSLKNDENIYSISGHSGKEILTEKVNSDNLPCPYIKQELASPKGIDGNRHCVTRGEEVVIEVVNAFNEQCGTENGEVIQETVPVEDDQLATEEEELALRTVCDEKDQRLIVERDANQQHSSPLQTVRDENELCLVVERDGKERFSTPKEEVTLQSVGDGNEQCALTAKSARDENRRSSAQEEESACERNQFASLEEELNLYSGLHENISDMKSPPTFHKDELYLRKKQNENTTYTSRHEVFIGQSGECLSLEDELALETNKLCMRDADTDCETNEVIKEPVEEVSPASERGSVGSPHSAQSTGFVCFSASSSTNPADDGDWSSPRTPLKGDGANSLGNPRSILKNRNRYLPDEESSSKGVHFEENTKVETVGAETIKENIPEQGPENDSNAAKAKRKFKRFPLKKAYPIYYVTT